MAVLEVPGWKSVLAVVAHPDDESFGLGAVLSALVEGGVRVSVLCLTRGEASTLGDLGDDLASVREDELRAAAAELGVSEVVLRAHPDGGLVGVDLDDLVREVRAEAERVSADGLVGFDVSGVTGHSDHARATEAAVEAGRRAGLGVLAWTIPEKVAGILREEFGAEFAGHEPDEVDVVIGVSRENQMRAAACHPSQAVPGSVLWRRLELLGDHEYLRWLVTPSPAGNGGSA